MKRLLSPRHLSAGIGTLLLTALWLGAGCVDVADKGAEEEVPTDGKADTQRKPTDHGYIPFAAPQSAALTDGARFHAWEFDLTDSAEVHLSTGPVAAGGAEVDTVLYLYKEREAGWGSYLARNDDSNHTLWSALKRKLDKGRYRVLVKGYSASTRGDFAVTVDCDGAGCVPPVDPNACLFGETFNDLASQSALVVTGTRDITSAAELTELDRRRVVLAVQQSSHTDVTTAEEALAAVDEGIINRVDIYEPAAARTFVALEYGAGDNSYGAFFEGRSDTIVSSIHDGDLLGCSVVTETCLLGTNYHEMLSNPAFQGVSSRRVTEPTQLLGIEAAQAVRAVQESFADVTNLTEALAAVQDSEINVTGVYHTATGTELLAFEYGAGDNSYGAVFYVGSLSMAAAINDGDFYGCNLFAARGGAQIGEDCRAEGDCGEGLACRGIFAGVGRCAPVADPPGEGVECTSDSSCAAGLICAGASRGYGLCRPRWMRGSFSDVADAAIPDGGMLSRRIPVYGLATVDTDVELRLTIAHPHPSQIRITLTNPAGTQAVVFEGTPDDEGDIYLVVEGAVSGFSGDEQVNGEWQLAVEDRLAGGTDDAGRLVRWDLTVTSRWD